MVWSKTVTDAEILTVFREDSDPAFTAGEIANAIGLTTEGTRARLDSLAKAGRLGRKKSGERTVVYWLED